LLAKEPILRSTIQWFSIWLITYSQTCPGERYHPHHSLFLLLCSVLLFRFSWGWPWCCCHKWKEASGSLLKQDEQEKSNYENLFRGWSVKSQMWALNAISKWSLSFTSEWISNQEYWNFSTYFSILYTLLTKQHNFKNKNNQTQCWSYWFNSITWKLKIQGCNLDYQLYRTDTTNKVMKSKTTTSVNLKIAVSL
jgi:hypothetical protein